MSLSATRTVGIIAAFGTIFSAMATPAHAFEPQPGNLTKTTYLDFDGDGRQDRYDLERYKKTDDRQFCGVRFDLATGVSKTVKFDLPYTPDSNMLECFGDTAIVDFNGDGKHEIITYWSVDGFRPPVDQAPIISLDGMRLSKSRLGFATDDRYIFADLNGDKRTDVVNTHWIANVGEDPWTPKDHTWVLTGKDAEPFGGKALSARGSGIIVADIDRTTPGQELVIPHGRGKTNTDGDFVTEACFLQVVRGGQEIKTTELKGIKHCNPESSVALDTDDDGFVDTLEVTWVNDTVGPVGRFKTQHRFNERGQFADGPVVSPKAPVANRDYVKMSFQWGLEGLIPVLKNDKNVDGGVLSIDKLPRHGDAIVRGDRIVYTRTHMKRGWDSLVYKVTTPNGKSSTAKLRIQMVGNPPSKDPNVRNVAKNDRVRMYPGSFEVADINVLRNDKVYGVVKVSVDTPPKIGTAVALDNGRIRYDRRGKGYGTDRFTYTVTDPKGRKTTAVVLVETPRRF